MTRRLATTRLALLAAILALVSQLALGSVVLPDRAPAGELAALAAATIDCAPASGDKGAPPAPRHEGDRALCPLSIALALPAVILLPAPALPAPVAMQAVRGTPLPPVRAPPSIVRRTPFPTGPPRLA